MVRPKTAVPSFDKSPARPRGPPQGSDTTGPGAYDAGKKFGNDIKPMTIGRKRPQPPKESDKNPGAGNYDPDRGMGLTKPKVPGCDMGKSPSRPSTFAKPGSDPYGGPDPGTYDAVRKFGGDVKPMTIGVKRPKKFTSDAPGPDAYQPSRGDHLTKPKVPGVDMGKSPSRPSTFAKPGTDADGGPGTYDTGKKFMDDVKPFTIG